jgi:hypothetical protein
MVDNKVEEASKQEDVRFDIEYDEEVDVITEDKKKNDDQYLRNGEKKNPKHGIGMDEDVDDLEDPPSQRNKHNLEMRNLLPRNL